MKKILYICSGLICYLIGAVNFCIYFYGTPILHSLAAGIFCTIMGILIHVLGFYQGEY